MNLPERYQSLLQRIHLIESKQAVQLLAVSKTKPIEMIKELAELGQKSFGENYLQEALAKIDILPELDWHFIGTIQSNKTKLISENFSWVHSVDRLKIAQRLNDQRPDNLPPLNILLAVNIDNEATKSGFLAEETLYNAKLINELPKLKLRGLMAIPKKRTGLENQRQPFKKLRELLEKINAETEAKLDTLSIGMSDDLEAAILEGATIVRIGRELFGKRSNSN